MRVLTQNLWGVRGAWELRRKVIQQGLAELKPDVVSLQEAVKTADVDSAADVLGKGSTWCFSRILSATARRPRSQAAGRSQPSTSSTSI